MPQVVIESEDDEDSDESEVAEFEVQATPAFKKGNKKETQMMITRS